MLLNERRKQMVNTTSGKTLKTGAKKGPNKTKEKRIKRILTKKATAKYDLHRYQIYSMLPLAFHVPFTTGI